MTIVSPGGYPDLYRDVYETLGNSYLMAVLGYAVARIDDRRINDAMRALFAYPDCTYMFDLHPDAVKTLAACDNPAAALLYPVLVLLHDGD